MGCPSIPAIVLAAVIVLIIGGSFGMYMANLYKTVSAAKAAPPADSDQGKRQLRWGRPGILRRQLAERLGFGGLAIAAALGGAVLWSDLGRIDKALLSLAKADAARLSPGLPEDLEALDAEARSAVEDRLKAFITAGSANPDGRFAVASIYDLHHRLVADSVAPDRVEAADVLSFPRHRAIGGEKAWHTARLVSGQLYLLVATPLYRPDGKQNGWFEGIYHLPRPILSRIVVVELRTTMLVIVAVLATTALLYPVISGLNHGLFTRSQALLQANLGTLEALGSAIAKRDSDTNSHNYRVALIAVRLAEAAGLQRQQVRALIKGAFLHDLGKLAIPDAVLLKPARLDEAEFAVMKTHVAHGLDIVNHLDWLADAADVVGCHHEWYDGSGYPRGLKGEEIPLIARIFSIADVFDALTSRRPYKVPFPLDKAVDLLEQGRGTHFDPRLLDKLLELAPRLYADLAGREDAGLESELHAVTQAYFAETVFG